MQIHEEDIDRLSLLAKLEFTASEKQSILLDLENISTFFAKIGELPTENVAPLVYMNVETNVLRSDVSVTLLQRTEALQNAPATDNVFFVVPKIIQGK